MISFSGGNIDQGIVSNDCFPDGDGLYTAGNSLFISANDVDFNGGLKDLPGPGNTVTVVSIIATNHSNDPLIAMERLHPACNCTIIYKQCLISRIMSMCGKPPAIERCVTLSHLWNSSGREMSLQTNEWVITVHFW